MTCNCVGDCFWYLRVRRLWYVMVYVNTQYIVERHADTLLPQYLGMYRITINDSETYVVVVRNIFSARLTVHRKYDLKVCLADRYHLAA